jgi:hypothetical protein
VLCALFISRIAFPVWQSVQEFPTECDCTVTVDDAPPSILNVSAVVAFVTYFGLELEGPKTFLQSVLKVSLILAKWVLHLA